MNSVREVKLACTILFSVNLCNAIHVRVKSVVPFLNFNAVIGNSSV